MTRHNEIPVRHGYSVEHLDRLARIAAKRAFGRTTADPLDRIDIAWTGIVEHLYEAVERPTTTQLLLAGTTAILDWDTATRRAHGVPHHRIWAGPGTMPQFARYWSQRSTPSPEDPIVERLSVHQIWPTLTPQQQESLTALAVHGTLALAAEAIGINYFTFWQRIKRARAAFLHAWHQGETPPKVKPGRAR